MSHRFGVVVASLMLVAGVAACGEEQDNEAGVAQSVSVEAFDNYFEPTSLAVDVGAQVTIEFSNTGGVSHSWSSPDLDAEVEATSGEDGSVTFSAPNEPGSYDFFCKFHPDEMQGTISIGGSDEPVEEAPEETEDDEDVDVDVDTEDENDAGSDTTTDDY